MRPTEMYATALILMNQCIDDGKEGIDDISESSNMTPLFRYAIPPRCSSLMRDETPVSRQGQIIDLQRFQHCHQPLPVPESLLVLRNPY